MTSSTFEPRRHRHGKRSGIVLLLMAIIGIFFTGVGAAQASASTTQTETFVWSLQKGVDGGNLTSPANANKSQKFTSNSWPAVNNNGGSFCQVDTYNVSPVKTERPFVDADNVTHSDWTYQRVASYLKEHGTLYLRRAAGGLNPNDSAVFISGGVKPCAPQNPPPSASKVTLDATPSCDGFLDYTVKNDNMYDAVDAKLVFTFANGNTASTTLNVPAHSSNGGTLAKPAVKIVMTVLGMDTTKVFTKAESCFTHITPVKPVLSDRTAVCDGTKVVVTQPTITVGGSGVNWTDNGQPVSGIYDVSPGSMHHLVAMPASDNVKLEGQTVFDIHVSDVVTNPDCRTPGQPAPATFKEGTCTTGPTFTVPTSTVAVYEVNGQVVKPGTYVADFGSKVTVTAVAKEGVKLNGQTVFTHTFGAKPTNCSVVTPPKPPVDVCTNLPGTQPSTPSGMVNNHGYCYTPQTTVVTHSNGPIPAGGGTGATAADMVSSTGSSTNWELIVGLVLIGLAAFGFSRKLRGRGDATVN